MTNHTTAHVTPEPYLDLPSPLGVKPTQTLSWGGAVVQPPSLSLTLSLYRGSQVFRDRAATDEILVAHFLDLTTPSLAEPVTSEGTGVC